MRTEQEVRALAVNVSRTVKEGTDRGAPAAPTTVLERHAFEVGRLSILKWMMPEPPTGTPV